MPESVVYHQNGHSLRQGSFRRAYLNHRNNPVLLLENLPWQRAIRVVPLRVLLLVAGIAVLGAIRRNWRQPMPALLGTIWVAMYLPGVLRRRRRARAIRSMPDAAVLDRLHGQSVVIAGFARGGLPVVKHAGRTDRRNVWQSGRGLNGTHDPARRRSF
jgi:hypothetical protein